MNSPHMKATSSGAITREILRNEDFEVTAPSAFERVGVPLHAALTDRRLSWMAKGLLITLLTREAGSTLSYGSLCAMSRDGRITVYQGIRELEDHGYLRGSATRWDVVAYPDAASSDSKGK